MGWEPKLRETLLAVAGVMAGAHHPWWIIASAAVALHGADPGHVRDVDVLLHAADARRILPRLGIHPGPGAHHADFRSDLFAVWTGNPLPVEFMADFYHRGEQGWEPVRPATRMNIEVGGAALYVPKRQELALLLRRFGREKDLARAALLDTL